MSQSPSLSGDEVEVEEEEEDEGVDGYRKGGYHAVRPGDQFAAGRYVAQRKLGWGNFSTVWLAFDVQSQVRPIRPRSRHLPAFPAIEGDPKIARLRARHPRPPLRNAIARLDLALLSICRGLIDRFIGSQGSLQPLRGWRARALPVGPTRGE